MKALEFLETNMKTFDHLACSVFLLGLLAMAQDVKAQGFAFPQSLRAADPSQQIKTLGRRGDTDLGGVTSVDPAAAPLVRNEFATPASDTASAPASESTSEPATATPSPGSAGAPLPAAAGKPSRRPALTPSVVRSEPDPVDLARPGAATEAAPVARARQKLEQIRARRRAR